MHKDLYCPKWTHNFFFHFKVVHPERLYGEKIMKIWANENFTLGQLLDVSFMIGSKETELYCVPYIALGLTPMMV